ncbi:hypothetical protein IHE56_00660 [Streptomyces sp. ID01-12c]|nr:hypothetical protein [Streptomyces caniscabiei]
MNTAIAITAIIAATLLANSIVVALRDAAKAKHQACPNCGRDKNRENS